VAVARDLLRLLPTHSFSLIIYLCAFFTQVPLCPENGITLEDIGRIFGPAVFGGPVPAARRMMVWFLKRWNRVSDSLLVPEPPDDCASSSSSSSAAARYLERADSFELLAPEEEDEEELGFRAAPVDPLDERRRPTSYYHHLLPVLPDRERQRSLEPDDSISQVSDGRSNDDAQEALHVFASTAAAQHRPSMTSGPGDGPHHDGGDTARWGFADAQLLIALSRLHEARARIDRLEHAVVDAATQSELACEKLAYGPRETVGGPGRDEANVLVENVCAMLKGVVQPALA